MKIVEVSNKKPKTGVSIFSRDDCPKEINGEFVIPEGIREIGNNAFGGCTGITSIVIPNTVKRIDDLAFSHTSLTNVSIPDSVTKIGGDGKYLWQGAFLNCLELKSVVIPKSVTEIALDTFAHCPNLTNVEVSSENPNYCTVDGVLYDKAVTTLIVCPKNKECLVIPDTVNTIATSAFQDCTHLTKVVIPNSVSIIGFESFSNCISLTKVEIPDSVTKLGSAAFEKCMGLESVKLSGALQKLPSAIFSQCENLKNVELPNTLSEIGETNWNGGGAFQGCASLTKMVIPAGVKKVARYLFKGCANLTSVEIPDSVTCIGESAFENCTSLASLTIPGYVSRIEIGAFKGCTSLKTINIPESVVEISYNSFEGCTSLVGFEVAPSNVNYSSIAGILYNRGKTELVYCPATVDNVEIPDTVTEIKASAFFNCTKLKSIVIPESVTLIDLAGFKGCANLEKVEILGAKTKIGFRVFEGCPNLVSVNVPKKNTKHAVVDGVLYDKKKTELIFCPKNLEKVTIPDSVANIRTDAFNYCKKLKCIEMSKTLESEIRSLSAVCPNAKIELK